MYVKRTDVIEALTGWVTDPTDDEIEFAVNHLPSLTKVYQLHEYNGSYEDYRDWIRGSYLRRERAKEEKAKREAEQKALERRSDLCANCLFIGEDASVMEKLLSKYPDYCDKKEFYIDTYDNCIECQNYYQHYDKSIFKVIEVEVEA